MPIPEERVSARRRKLLNLRRARGGVYGLSYGISAYGYPLGAIAGVQGVPPADQAPSDPPISSDQFGGTDTGSDSGTGADSGGAV